MDSDWLSFALVLCAIDLLSCCCPSAGFCSSSLFSPRALLFCCGCSHVEPSIFRGMVVVVLLQMNAGMEEVSGQ